MRLFALVTLIAALALPAAADDDDHGRARAAMAAGKIVSMEALLERVRADFPGRVLRIEVEDEDDAPSGWAYEVKVLGDDGVVVEVEYDAATLEVIEVEGGRGFRLPWDDD